MIRLFGWVGTIIVLGALAAACGGENRSGETAVTAAGRPAVVASAPTGALEWSVPVPAEPVPVADRPVVVVSVPETAPAEAAEQAVAVSGVSGGLLSVVIPPCTPLDGVDRDPCSSQLPPSIHPGGLTASIPSFVKNPPSFDDIMTGMGIDTPHIVVRVTVEPGTTRCEGYPTKDFAYVGGSISDITNYWCFADVRVNDYIVGAGPPTLTIGLLRNTFLPSGDRDWERDKDWAIEHEFKNPAARTAATYEGRELVLFLKPTPTMTVEAWTVGGGWDTWFVRRDPDTDPPGVTAAFRWENRVVSEADLDDLVTEVTAAAAARTTTDQTSTAQSSTENTTQPTTTVAEFWDRPPPYLVTRADQLRDFYIAGGAVYEGDDATTVLPPPAPIPPGVPTNVAVTQNGDRWFITWDAAVTGGDTSRYYLWIDSTRSDGTVTSFYNTYTLEAETEFEITYMAAPFGEQFTVQVRGWNSHGYSDWTETETLTTPPSVTTTTTSTTSAPSSTTSTSA